MKPTITAMAVLALVTFSGYTALARDKAEGCEPEEDDQPTASEGQHLLHVLTEPPGTAVQLSGEKQAERPPTFYERPPGDYTLEVRALGYGTQEIPVQITDQDLTLNVQLRRHDLHALGGFLTGLGGVAVAVGASMLGIGIAEEMLAWTVAGACSLGAGVAFGAGGIPILVKSYAVEPEITYLDEAPVY